MKITAKTTKEELKSFLGANAKAVKSKDKGLFDRIAYASKVSKEDDTKVKRTDLVSLAKEVISTLGDAVVEAMDIHVPALATAENSVKKLAKGVSKKQEITKDDEAEDVGDSDVDIEEVKEEAPKKAKKSVGAKKKEAPKKKDGVVALESNSDKTAQMAKIFPKTLEVGDVKYELASDIKSMDDLYEALGNDEEIVFAYYWTKRHLRQFPYYSGLLGQPKSFDNDLDLATAIYVSDEKKVTYQVSMYTEALYAVIPTDFAEEDGVRINNGIEYQIYRAV